MSASANATAAALARGLSPDDNRAPLTYGLLGALIPLTTIIVGLRFYCRMTTRKLGWDDWVTLISLIFMYVMSFVELAEVHYGMGRHKVFLDPEDYMLYNRAFYVDVIFYNCALASIKLQVLLQYFRLFDVRLGIMRKVLVWVTVVVCVWGVFTILSAIVSCVPLAAFWDHTIQGRCFPIVDLAYTHAAGHIFTDLVIFALPIRLIWSMRLPRAQRLSLYGIFGLAFVTCCFSMIRIGWLNIDRGGDDSYYNIEAAGWSIGELACAMAVTCMPTLRPLFFKVRSGGSGKEGWMWSSAPPTIGGSGEKRAHSPSDSGSYTDRSWLADSEKGFDEMSLNFETTPSSFSDPTWSAGAAPPFPSAVQRPTRPVLLDRTGYTTTTKVSLASRQASRDGRQVARSALPKSRPACTCTCQCGLR